ncbi:hypothetical protein HYU06_04065 [Candidatus Woesearchaeota archaeon]|nr:hypothetical protein [Candidatus Woesearchaeota archaeon]
MKEPPRPSNTLENIMESFSEEQLSIIMKNLGAIQLTDGCSVGCHFCGFEAQRGIKVYFPYDQLARLASRFSKELATSQPFLYYASDPFDYDFDGHDYVEVHSIFAEQCGYSPSVSTTVPVGREELVVKLLLTPNEYTLRKLRQEIEDVVIVDRDGKKVDTLTMVKLQRESEKFDESGKKAFAELNGLIDVNKNWTNIFRGEEILNDYDYRLIWQNSLISRVSVSHVNRRRLERAFYSLVPNLMPENQTVLPYEMKPEECYLTNDTLFAILNAFGVQHSNGEYLSYSEHMQMQIFSLNDRQLAEIKAREERAANGNITGQLYVVELPGKRFVISPDKPVRYQDIIKVLASFQLDQYFLEEAYGSTTEISQLLKLGALNIQDLAEEGISCFHGVLITPAGVFNVQKVKPSVEYPLGQIITPISSSDFKVIRFERTDGSVDYSKRVTYIKRDPTPMFSEPTPAIR